MNAKTAMTTALLGMLLFAAPVAADEGEPESMETDDCAVVDVMTYYPYVAVRPHCLPEPLGQG